MVCLAAVLLLPHEGKAVSFDLDSIGQWGKFARFCVNTYRWGDKFFNTYDSTYVVGTGTKFNVKFKSDSWVDFYNFKLEDDISMNMISDYTTNVGVHLSYLAVSVGYDMNVSKFFNGYEPTRQRLNFSFNCALFSADFFYHRNDVTTTITSFDNGFENLSPNVKFKGISSDMWGVDIYYFLNNKRYSQSAAFSYGKIQRRSQGSWYFGLSYWNMLYDFNFGELADALKDQLPPNWMNSTYRVNTRTYSLRAGYAYNWVLGPHWLLAISESPTIGYRYGRVNNRPKNNLALSNLLRFSVVYNRRKLFLGLVGKVYTNLIRENESTMVGNLIDLELSIGYRFNIW